MMPSHLIKSISLSLSLSQFQVRTKSILLVTSSYNALYLIDTGTSGKKTGFQQSAQHVYTRSTPELTGESFWMRSWATCTKFLSSCMCFWKRLLSSSSSRSKSLAASSKACMRPFQERSAGTWGATAELTPVPITSTSSGARLVFRLGSSFLWGRQRLSDDASQSLPTAWTMEVSSSLRSQSSHWYFISGRGEGADIRNC